MALRPLLTAAERGQVLALPAGETGLATHYALGDADISLIRQHRGDANKLGFAIQLCLLRHPGITLADDTDVPPELIAWIATYLDVPATAWGDYAAREETRQEHGREIRTYLGMSAFGLADFRRLVEDVATVAAQTDKGLLLVEHAVGSLRARKVALPGITVIERACAQALTRANRGIYATLGEQLTVDGQKRLDRLLRHRPDSSLTEIGWLRQAPLRPNARAMHEHIDRLTAWRDLDLPGQRASWCTGTGC